MDIKTITGICNTTLSDKQKEHLILDILSKDKNVLTTMLSILDEERKNNKELILDLNATLSLAHAFIEKPKLTTKEHVIKTIVEFYSKYKGVVGQCIGNLLPWDKIK